MLLQSYLLILVWEAPLLIVVCAYEGRIMVCSQPAATIDCSIGCHL